MPNSVTTIGSKAFNECNRLTNITMSNNLQYIGNFAFENCSKLTSITIPDGILYVDGKAFDNCKALEYNEYKGGKYLGNAKNPYLVLVELVSKDIISMEIHPNTKIICNAFSNCESLVSVIIPDGVTMIADNAFLWCKALTSVKIPDSVTSIGNGAFWGCTSLKKIVIPKSVTSIDEYAFKYCTNLTIYCESSSRPVGFVANWSYCYQHSNGSDGCTVIWGYTK